MLGLTYSIADQNVATTKSMGIYNLSVNLAQNLAVHPQLKKLTVFSNRSISPSLCASDKTILEEHNGAMENKAGRICWDQWGVYQSARKAGNPWLFLPKGFCSFVKSPPLRVAAYVHDTMGNYYREQGRRFQSRFEDFYFTRSLAATLREAAVIFANTEFSKKEILRLARQSGILEPKIAVVGYGFAATTFAPVKKENRVVLFASKLPHKRTDIAIRFLDQWVKQTRFDGVIDCIGILSPEMEKPSGRHWNWIGRVPPATGRDMMRRARAIVYVSEYEGFGMPPVEAVLEGTCPVFSDLPPLREVMGKVGFSFSNDSAENFNVAMEKALAVSAETLRFWSQELLARHHWPGVTGKIVEELLRHA
ncbi:MAG: glycosyltransferase [Verrucomicrobiota bacterium]